MSYIHTYVSHNDQFTIPAVFDFYENALSYSTQTHAVLHELYFSWDNFVNSLDLYVTVYVHSYYLLTM